MALVPPDLALAQHVPALAAGSRLLVTGGAGFIGSHLAAHLKALGMHVVGLDNFDPYYSPALKHARKARAVASGVEFVEGDMCDASLLRRLFAEHNFTHVASLAAQAGVRYSVDHPQAYVRANVECFVSLLETLRLYPSTKLVYASSSSVYGTNAKVPSPRTGGRLGGHIPISMSMSLDSGLPRLQMLSLSTSAA